MGRYDGKTAVITGGVSGMGAATAQLLASEGAEVLVTGRTDAAVDEARDRFGGRVRVERSDAASLADIDALAETVSTAFGSLDLLYLNAGVAAPTPFVDVRPELWDEVFAINVRGPYFTTQRFVPILAEGSSVVLTTSIADEAGMPALSVYAASKAALRSLARTLARELAPRVRVNAVSPGPIETPMVNKLGQDPASIQGYRKSTASANPSSRWGRPDEIARAVAFLAFEATYTTGHELPVDGGASQL